MADWITLLGYASGVYFIKPDLDVQALTATVAAVHLCDGVLCLVIAKHSGRNRLGWTLAGLGKQERNLFRVRDGDLFFKVRGRMTEWFKEFF